MKQTKSEIATKNHLNNIKKLSKGNLSRKEIEKIYDYLDYCWSCGKPITLWDRLTFNVQHSFEGDSHRRNCK